MFEHPPPPPHSPHHHHHHHQKSSVIKEYISEYWRVMSRLEIDKLSIRYQRCNIFIIIIFNHFVDLGVFLVLIYPLICIKYQGHGIFK